MIDKINCFIHISGSIILIIGILGMFVFMLKLLFDLTPIGRRYAWDCGLHGKKNCKHYKEGLLLNCKLGLKERCHYNNAELTGKYQDYQKKR